MNLRLALLQLAAQHELNDVQRRRLTELAGMETEPCEVARRTAFGVAVLGAVLGGLAGRGSAADPSRHRRRQLPDRRRHTPDRRASHFGSDNHVAATATIAALLKQVALPGTFAGAGLLGIGLTEAADFRSAAALLAATAIAVAFLVARKWLRAIRGAAACALALTALGTLGTWERVGSTAPDSPAPGAGELIVELTPKNGRYVPASGAWYFKEGKLTAGSAPNSANFALTQAVACCW